MSSMNYVSKQLKKVRLSQVLAQLINSATSSFLTRLSPEYLNITDLFKLKFPVHIGK